MSGWLEKMPGIRDIVYGLVTMPRRSKLKFTGAGVSVADDGSQTVVTVSGGGGGGGYTESEVVDAPTGTNDNYNPAGWADCTSLIVTSTTPVTITGFAAPGSGKPYFRRISFVGGAGSLTIAHMSSGSSAGNKVECPNPFDAALTYDVTLTKGSTAWITYNANNARWQLVSLSGRDRYQAPPMYFAGTAVVGSGGWLGADNAVVAAAGPGPYVMQGAVAPTPGSRGSVKLLRFAIAATVKHEDGTVGTAANRINVTSGGDWAASVGDFAILSYDAAATRWVLHPLKTAAAPVPGTTSAQARTYATTVVQTWTGGSATPTFTYSAGSAVNGAEETILFPASTLTSIAFSADIDPTGALAYAFDDSAAAYVFHSKFIGAGPCILATFRKVTDLP